MNKAMIGTYGEYFTATRLLSWGNPAVVVPGSFKFDIVTEVAGRAVRIQVKSTSREVTTKSGRKDYQFNTRSPGSNRTRQVAYEDGDYDIMALVAVPEYRMIFLPFHKKQSIQRAASEFTREMERQTWEDCLASLGLKE